MAATTRSLSHIAAPRAYLCGVGYALRLATNRAPLRFSSGRGLAAPLHSEKTRNEYPLSILAAKLSLAAPKNGYPIVFA